MSRRKVMRVGCWLMAVVMIAWSYGPALAAEAKPAKDKQPAAQTQAEPMTTRDQVAKEAGQDDSGRAEGGGQQRKTAGHAAGRSRVDGRRRGNAGAAARRRAGHPDSLSPEPKTEPEHSR